MSPIQVLMDEHRLIERVIDGLIGYAAADAGSQEDLVAFVAFIRGFADAHHHGKEEDILFQAMIEQGMPADTGPLAVMLHEHDEGRGYTKILAQAAGRDGALDPESRIQVARAAKSYASLLRAHIQKEDQVLYPMADQMLPESVWKAIEKAFADFESDEPNAVRASELRASAEALIAKYASTAE